MHFLPLYSFIIMMMPFFNPVDLRMQAAASVGPPGSRPPNDSPIYADNILFFEKPKPPKDKTPPSITTANAADTVSRLIAKSQPSPSGNKYRFNRFKKGTAASRSSSNKVPRPSSNMRPSISAIKRPSSASTSSSTDNTYQTRMPASASEEALPPMLQIPFSIMQFIGSPLLYVYHLFKPDEPGTIIYLQEASTPKQHPTVSEICQVLASSRIYYPGCHPVCADREEMFRETTSKWTVEDENGVKWKRVNEGKEEGCIFYLKADPTPLRVSATPNKDGTTDVNYYTKHTVGKYCPQNDDDEEEIRLFYESLLEYGRKPTAFDIIMNTKVLFNYTLKNVVELMFVIDALVMAAKKVFSVYSYRYWSFRALLSLYFISYLGYTYYTAVNGNST